MAEPKNPGDAAMKNFMHMASAKTATSMLITKYLSPILPFCNINFRNEVTKPKRRKTFQAQIQMDLNLTQIYPAAFTAAMNP